MGKILISLPRRRIGYTDKLQLSAQASCYPLVELILVSYRSAVFRFWSQLLARTWVSALSSERESRNKNIGRVSISSYPEFAAPWFHSTVKFRPACTVDGSSTLASTIKA